MSDEKLITCYSCGGTKVECIFITQRDNDCLNFRACFPDLLSARNHLSNIGIPNGTIIHECKVCNKCNGIGLINPPPCSFCNDTKTYISVINDERHVRECEVCQMKS